jgi:hypothetical protein
MSDNRPRTPDRKFALIAPIVIGAAAVVVLVVVLLRPHPAPPAKVAPPPLVPAPSAAAVSAPPKIAPAARADLIADADVAASAFAAGQATPPSKLVGERFSIRLAFGCGGPVADPGPLQAYYQLDAATRTVRLVARPATWTDLPLVRAAATTQPAETVEGFWIPRPWLRIEGCPYRREVAPPATPTPVEAPSLGLAMFHSQEASRAERRGDRPYEHVFKLPADRDGQKLSFRLLLEGRISGFSDRSAVRCWGESVDHRPVCLYGVDVDRVAFEAEDGTLLADWPR